MNLKLKSVKLSREEKERAIKNIERAMTRDRTLGLSSKDLIGAPLDLEPITLEQQLAEIKKGTELGKRYARIWRLNLFDKR